MNIAYLDHTCKAGENMDDYADAFYPDYAGLSAKSSAFALSDGITQGMLNREWAGVLVRSFSDCVDSRLGIKEVLLNAIEKSIPQWETIRQQYVNRRDSVLNDNEYRWLFEYGSHATFLGLRFQSDYWEAVAIGDTCLFVLDRRESCLVFPIEEASDFTDSPNLVSSFPDRNADIDQHIKYVRKRLQSGNTFYMMTDALAQWFVSEYRLGRKPWHQISDNLDHSGVLAFDHRQREAGKVRHQFRSLLRRVRSRGKGAADNAHCAKTSFSDWVSKLRESGQVVNDDTTLVILKP